MGKVEVLLYLASERMTFFIDT
ncbi:protein of unknown function [Mesotoga infera]|uniref:Uncharacterized protein n=1 Tax=Mesotoga infera TaxID=1236046 RepID=A0A7Z7PPE5_9BACT|nr:protein of unknown function [Mesotoga infera]